MIAVADNADDTRTSGRRSPFDAVLVLLLLVACCLLGCYCPSDTDLWWHLRGGEWIIEHARAPGLDPFTYGSADRKWIDVHWLFEVLLALVFRLAGISGTVYLAALVGAAALATALLAKRRRGLVGVAVVCWIPAVLMMSVRLNARPEIFSLLFLAAYLAVLSHAAERPALGWLLVPTQLLWVNVQGLFVLGPVVLVLFIASNVVEAAREPSRTGSAHDAHFWRHLLGASLGVAAVCFVNPYGVRGALFPLELFPKISDPTSPYKVYIDEFHSPMTEAFRVGDLGFDHLVYFNVLYFLLLALPLSFLVPAVWQACGAGIPPAPKKQTGRLHHNRTHPGRWLGGFAAAVALLATSAVVSQSPPGSGWRSTLQDLSLIVAIFASITATVALWRRSREAAALVLAGGLAEASAMYYLHLRMSSGPLAAAQPAIISLGMAGVTVATALVVRHGGDLFRMLVGTAFAYLALHAMRNLNLFGLTAGVIISANFNDWFWRLAEASNVETPPLRWWSRAAIATILVGWLAAIPTDAYRAWTGDRRVFGTRELPLVFPHDAARFAGSAGMPDRALVYHLGLAGLYVYHNAPEKKVYMDPRLELPSREVFETYVGLERLLEKPGDAWVAPLRKLGAGCVLLDHGQHARVEAALLAQGDWRCVYYDALASVFVSSDSSPSAGQFPTVDFAKRHFRQRASASTPEDRDAAFYEASGLVNVASYLRREPDATWTWRIPALWHALDRLDVAEATTTHLPDLWMLRGQCHWNLVPDLTVLPPTPADGWTAAALPWAQSTWCFRQALALTPDHVGTLRQLYNSWRARRMSDAQLAVFRQLPTSIATNAKGAEDLGALEQELASFPEAIDVASPNFDAVASFWMARGCLATIAEKVKEKSTNTSAWDWELTDRLAAAWMHLGEPAEARQLWSASATAPAKADRLARLGDSFLVEREYSEATRLYREALSEDPRHAHTCLALTSMYAQRGQAGAALDTCKQAMGCELSADQRRFFEEVRSLVEPYSIEY